MNTGFMVSTVLFLLMVPFFHHGLQAQNPEEMSPQQLTDALMEASGFNNSLLDVWYGIEGSIEQEEEFSQTQATRVKQLLRSGFYGEKLTSSYHNRLLESLDIEHATRVITFLQSDTGKYILELEAQETNATDSELNDFAAEFDPNDPTNTIRIDLVADMMVETRARENTTLILHALYTNLLLTANAADNPPEGRMGGKEFESTSEIIRVQLKQQMREYLLISMLYTYRNAEPAYLESYLKHLRSESGRWYTSTLHDILIDVLEDAHETVINEIRLTDS